jgi:P-type conjugative transfer protein VirB9
MKRLLSLLSTICIYAFGFCSHVAHAEAPAIPMPGDTRLVTFTYDEHNTYQLLARPKSVTDVQFHGEEHIRAVALGDTVQWEVAKTGDGQHLFVKPKFENITTSATVVTDKRTYQLILTSNTERGKWYQRVTWEYPDLLILEETKKEAEADKSEAEQKRLSSQVMNAGVALESVNFNYSISGDAPFRPLGAFDDGRFTYLRMPPNVQELPALFLVSDNSDAELINYVVKGEYLVVQRLIDSVLLKIGKHEVRVTNAKTSKSQGFLDLFKG